jgi:hypothetical protein
VDVIWLTDNILYSREETTRTIFNVSVLDKIIDPSLVTGEALSLVME